MNVPKRAAQRISSELKRFQPILQKAQSRDVNEADTVLIVTDILSDMFGYDKYSEITREYAIRNTFVDLAIKINEAIQLLIEVKEIGADLKEAHLRQAVNYAVNAGVSWVILTNGIKWIVYRITYSKPIDKELVFDLDLLTLNPKNKEHIEQLFILSREGKEKSMLKEYYERLQAVNKYYIASIILSQPLIDHIRREVRRVTPGIRIEPEEIERVLKNEVLKREVVEGEKAIQARKLVKNAADRALRKVQRKKRRDAVSSLNKNAETSQGYENQPTPSSQ